MNDFSKKQKKKLQIFRMQRNNNKNKLLLKKVRLSAVVCQIMLTAASFLMDDVATSMTFTAQQCENKYNLHNFKKQQNNNNNTDNRN